MIGRREQEEGLVEMIGDGVTLLVELEIWEVRNPWGCLSCGERMVKRMATGELVLALAAQVEELELVLAGLAGELV